jgi:electron transport complex protein RnfD
MINSTITSQRIMLSVCIAALPGVLTMIWFFGFGVALNFLSCIAFCLVFEAGILVLRNKPVSRSLLDGSAVVTGLLLGLSLPPLLPFWMLFIACFFAMGIAKHLYGGLGQNLFNPAMVGYAVLLVSFPLAMSAWPEARITGIPSTDWRTSLLIKASLLDLPDAFTMATPLDIFRHREGQTVTEIWQQGSAFGFLSGRGWEWINFAYLAGGIWLVYKKYSRWHASASFLIVLGLLSIIFYDAGSSASHGSPAMHWFGGATMLGAFFILTDPATAPDTRKGLLVYGALAGLLVYIIRTWGAYPDGIAFAILLVNMATPVINYLTVPGVISADEPQDV